MTDTLANLALALGAGLIVGMERGWQERTAAEGSRIAGIRTFGLLGLLGGLWQLLTRRNPIAFAFGYVALGLVMAAAHYAEAKEDRDYGVTTVVAAMITFALGALAVRGERVVAASGAVVVAVLLNLKPILHRWLERIEPNEINAALKLLLISVVVLPVLPNRGYGPWEALNPYELWLLVVLIAAISFAAYIVVRIAGPERGILLTGLVGGLVSSTAVTLQLARMSKSAERSHIFAAGTLIASATMFVRVLIITTLIQRPLWKELAWPVLVMIVPLVISAIFFARKANGKATELQLRNPVEIGAAVRFGAVLAGIMLLSKAVSELWGSAGVYLVAGVAGLADVDAIAISVARMTFSEIEIRPGAHAIILATLVNTATKGVISTTIGSRKLGKQVLIPMAAALVAGGLLILVL